MQLHSEGTKVYSWEPHDHGEKDPLHEAKFPTSSWKTMYGALEHKSMLMNPQTPSGKCLSYRDSENPQDKKPNCPSGKD